MPTIFKKLYHICFPAVIFTAIQYLMRRQWFFILAMLISLAATAQSDTSTRRGDTTVQRDTARAQQDTAARRMDSIPPKPAYSFLLDSHIYNKQPFFKFTNPVKQLASKRHWEGKEPFFYATVALLIFFALVRNNFARYSSDLFSLFFRTSIKQRQIKEQLMQAPLPSLLLNLLFFMSGGLFINLLLHHFNLGTSFNFWLLFLYCIAGLAAIYIIKFLTMKICGWLFRLSDVTDTYTFIVFTTNKIIGIALLPFIILLSFSSGSVQEVAFTLSLIVVGFLFIYRYFLSYVSIHRQIKINFFHFLLYLLAFEIIPLLLINKVLFKFLGESS